MKQIHNKIHEFSKFEVSLMKQLINEANIHIRKTYPNPRVAAAIYKNDKIISIGVHQKKGTDHAEQIAIKAAKSKAKGANIMITLEPCTHTGSTPPCVDAIIKAGIKKVVFASFDPFSKVVQNPAKKILSDNNIEVQSGLFDSEAQSLNHDYFYAHKNKRPWVHLKAAMSLDGKIALHNKKSKYLTGQKSLQKVHEIRSTVAAIVIGANTLIYDNPSLTIRFDFFKKNNIEPYIFVIGTHFDTKKKFEIFNSEYKTILVSSDKNLSEKNTFFTEVWNQDLKNNEFDWDTFLNRCYQNDLFSVLLEGGARIFSSALKQNIVNEYSFFIAPKLIGDNSALAVVDFGQINDLDNIMNLSNAKVETLGDDFLVSGYFKE